ncbi:MAG: HK97 gp10 family phage protein [Rhizobiaceae bacterium]|nr:HK97 gp10 family phage protein [Rhizobiaceae bacterium]MCV0406327.1 HK97 gp10 family phage protein [Rhizobiaceae bacterium]
MVQGLRSLNRKLTKTIPDRVRQRTRAAMERGADEIVAMAKSLVPVAEGDLRDSIGWTWGDAPKGATVLAQSEPTAGGERITIYAGGTNSRGVDVFWHRWQEFGTQHHAPNPFFYVSYRTLKRRVKGRISREMKKAIREGAK